MIIRPLGDVLVMMPPLAMPTSDLVHIVQAIDAELKELPIVS
jgi:adenosylmethionine-8-amino-7-oxononanoate aminotransferase